MILIVRHNFSQNGIRILGHRIITIEVNSSPFDNLSVAQLKDELRKLGLPLSGTKAILVKRLLDNTDQQTANQVSSFYD